jgi:hypothetical protein
LNGLTTQVQFFAVGTSGTDFNIASSVDTHTFNLPTASGTNRGALSSTDWTTFNNKENAITAGTTAQYFRGDKTFQTLNTSVVPELTNLYYTEARVNANTNVAANTAARHNAVTLGTANGLSLSTQVLSLGLASAGVTGALSGTDWSTFNSKQNALTNPVTGTGTTNYLPKFTGSTTIGNSLVFDNGTNVGIGTNNPLNTGSRNLDVNAGAGLTCYIFARANNNAGTVELAFDTDSGYVSTKSNHPLRFRTNDVTRVLITTNGRVLIGTPPPAESTFQLDVNGTGRFSSELSINSGATRALRIDTNSGVQGISLSPNSIFGVDEPGVGNGRFIINTSGNVGIANDSPSFRLDVSGTGRYFQNNTSVGNATGITLQQSGSGDIAISYQLTGVREWLMGIDNSDSDAFKINNITGSGDFNNTGLSIATSGAATFSSTLQTGSLTVLDVSANTFFYNTFSNAANRNWALAFGIGNLGDFNIMSSNAQGGNPISAGTSRLNIQTNGNVGIGTNNPAVKFQINDGTNINLGIKVGQTDSTAVMLNAYNDAVTANIPLEFRASRYNFTAGNFGINTLTANSRLQVSGSVSFPHTTKSANYTLDATDYTVGFDCASSRTANLPDATTCAGRIYVIYQYNTNNGARYVILDGNGSQTIDGVTTYSLQYQENFSSLMIQSTGSNWVVISDKVYPAPV